MSHRKHPIRNLTTKLIKHDAINRRNLSRIAVYYLKLFMQEPFRWREKLFNRDDIRQHQLREDPIFIIGHWRSGTSYMQYLLGQDPQFGYLNKFQAIFPEIFLHSEKTIKSWAGRIPQTINLIKDAKNMSINLKWDSPSEIEIALTTMISPASLHWGHIFPNECNEYFDKFLFFEGVSDTEVQQWRHDYSYLIDKISLKNDGRQILIKSPGNTSRIQKLLELYPNARFIYLHRNPYDIFYSSQKLWQTLLDNLALQHFDQAQMEQKIVAIYKKLLSRYLHQRSLIPEGQLVEIRFESFTNHPLESLWDIYEQLNIKNFEASEAEFRSFLEDQPQKSSASYQYEDRIIRWINREWKFAFDEWNYSMIPSVSFPAKTASSTDFV
jgi:hypothetical protein